VIIREKIEISADSAARNKLTKSKSVTVCRYGQRISPINLHCLVKSHYIS